MAIAGLDERLEQRLDEAEARFREVDRQLADPDVVQDPDRLRTLGQERAELEPVVEKGGELRELARELEGARELAGDEGDPEMQEMAREEVERLETSVAALAREVRSLLIPKDPLDDRPAVVEIRAGTGGDEAGLFAA
ncbi:MAG: PCRF domain-containing protein, partial [Longimicrobiales bacterium]|nr:PCRF domain-containing protein [Longimicrobiales bacterium]